MRRILGLATLLVALLAPAGSRAADYCGSDLDPTATAPAPAPGPALRFGIYPGGSAGQLGPVPASAKPEDPAKIDAALTALRAPTLPFVIKTYAGWKDAGDAVDARLTDFAVHAQDLGMESEFVLRYQPPAGHDGDVAGYAEWVRHLVRLLGPIPSVNGFQITNEVNFDVSPDSSDGSATGATDALVQGVIAGHDEAVTGGWSNLTLGFNYVYRWQPQGDADFWAHLRDAGARFRDALGWIGLDVYPGTFFPPVVVPGTEGDWARKALDVTRCFSRSAALPKRIPIRVEENGFPTDLTPLRSEARQAAAGAAMIRAINAYRGTYNVSDYRWFDLRDADSSDPNFQQHYGITHDDYSPKPAFGVYRSLIAQLG